PARFLLAGAMNPCPCGNRGHPKQVCRCDEAMIKKYQTKVSGALLDRIDLHVEVAPLPYGELRGNLQGDSSEIIRSRVLKAQAIQVKRFQGSKLHSNSQMGSTEIRTHCILKGKAEKILEEAVKKWGWSARAYHRILRVARTIADLAANPEIKSEHLTEAISYRALLLGPQS
ncbi:MAG: ATP-binding protein, partial [bacterium]|nr:ATP-binding protein [bacterium]